MEPCLAGHDMDAIAALHSDEVEYRAFGLP